MANHEQQSEAAAADSGAPRQPARRRFTRAGLASAGVVLTLHSKTGMAANACLSTSGLLSGMTRSHSPQTPPSCAGFSPGYWKDSTKHKWPIYTNTPFKQIFPGGKADCYTKLTMLQMLTSKDDSYNIGAHMVSAYLNILKKYTTVLTAQQLQKIWYDWVTYGYYKPSATVTWDGTDIVYYLKGTFDNTGHNPADPYWILNNK